MSGCHGPELEDQVSTAFLDLQQKEQMLAGFFFKISKTKICLEIFLYFKLHLKKLEYHQDEQL